jgi:hypothetical protein
MTDKPPRCLPTGSQGQATANGRTEGLSWTAGYDRLSALVTGTAATVVSTVALALLVQGRAKARSSQRTPPPAIGCMAIVQLRTANRTPLTRLSAMPPTTPPLFWAVPFQAWLAARQPRTAGALLRDACALGDRRGDRLRRDAQATDGRLGAGAVQAFDRGDLRGGGARARRRRARRARGSARTRGRLSYGVGSMD